MKKKILIHIGYPKTGSSTLQHNFFPNIKGLFFFGRYKPKYKNSDLFNKFNNFILGKINYNKKSLKNLKKKVFSIFLRENKNIIISQINIMVSFQTINKEYALKNHWENILKIKKFLDHPKFDLSFFIIERNLKESFESYYQTCYERFDYLTNNKYKNLNQVADSVLNEDHNYKVSKLFFETYNTKKLKSYLEPYKLHVINFNEMKKNSIKFQKYFAKILGIKQSSLPFNNIKRKKRISEKINGKNFKLIQKNNFLNIKNLFIQKITRHCFKFFNFSNKQIIEINNKKINLIKQKLNF